MTVMNEEKYDAFKRLVQIMEELGIPFDVSNLEIQVVPQSYYNDMEFRIKRHYKLKSHIPKL